MFSASRTGSSRSVSDPYFENVSLLLKDTGTNGAQNNTFVADPVVAPAGVGYLAGQFNGSSNLALPSNTTLDMASGDFTIEFWLFPNSVSGSAHLIAQQAQDFTIQFGNTLGDQLLVYDGANRVIGSVTAKTWTHVAIVRSGGVLQGYLNGVATGSSWSNTSSTKFSFSSAIIAARWGAANYYNGYISNVRIVKGTAVYTSNFTVPTSPLTAISGTSLLTCQSGSGATFADNSSINFAITVTGTPTMTGVATTPPGAVPYAGSFNGSQYLTVPAGSAFAYGTGNFTVEGWFFATASLPQYGATLFSQTVSGTNYFWCTLGDNTISPANKVCFTFATSGGGTSITSGSSTYVNNTWNHFAIVRNSGVVTVYLNGVGGTPTACTQDFSNTTYVPTIGRYTHTDGNNFTGNLSNLRVVKGTAVYTSNFAPPASPLTAITNTSLLTCQSATFVDNSSNAYTLTNTGSTPVVSSYILPTITRNGTPTQGSVTPYWPDGQWSNYFGGASDWMTIPASANTNVLGGDFTIEAWVFPTAFNAYNFIAMQDDGNSGSQNFQLIYTSTGLIRFTTWSTSSRGSFWEILSTTALTTNTWNHVAVTRFGSTTRVFLNGGQEVSSTNTVWAGGSVQTCIGNFSSGPNQTTTYSKLNGYVSNVRIVKGTALYTSNFTPSTTPLTAVSGTSLLTCQSNRFKDNSSNNFAITVTGTPTVQTFDPFNPASSYATTIGGSGYFDGGTSGLSIPSNSAYTLGTADFTIEVWIYATVAPSGTAYTVIRQRANGSLAWNLQIQSGTMYFCYGGGYTGFSEAVKVGVWEHYAAVKLSGSMYLYKNGVLSVTIANNFNFSATDGVMVGIGGDSSDTAYPFTGYIANARVVKGTAIYTAAFTPPAVPVTSTPSTSLLLNFTNAGIYDAATLNNLVTVGNAQVSTAQAKYGSSSMKFDGTGDYLSRSFTSTSDPMYLSGNTFTVEMWVYMASTSGVTIIYDCSATNTGSFAATSLFVDTGTVGFQLRPTTGGTNTIVSGGAVSTNTWTHLAFSINGGSGKLFVNGTQVGSTTTFPTAATFTPVGGAVGRFANGYVTGINDYNGYIEDLRITKGIARYTANFTPPQTFQTR